MTLEHQSPTDAPDDSATRGCYCGLWQTHPEHFPERNIPPGFCGICERCGAPGHTRHFPGPVPYTGAWCDRCYRIVGWRAMLLNPGAWVLIGAAIGLVWFLVRRHFG